MILCSEMMCEIQYIFVIKVCVCGSVIYMYVCGSPRSHYRKYLSNNTFSFKLELVIKIPFVFDLVRFRVPCFNYY